MKFSTFAKQRGLVGQKRVLKQLDGYVKYILKGNIISLLIQAPSGFSKTYTTDLLLEYLDYMFIEQNKGKSWNVNKLRKHAYTPKRGEGVFVYSQMIDETGIVILPDDFVVCFFDEAHMIKDAEVLYKPLDKKTKIIILATNV